jgi:hypothetical protein
VPTSPLFRILNNDAAYISIDNANTSSTWEDPITHVDDTPHDEEDNDLGDEDADDERGHFGIWFGGIKEIIDFERYVSAGDGMG